MAATARHLRNFETAHSRAEAAHDAARVVRDSVDRLPLTRAKGPQMFLGCHVIEAHNHAEAALYHMDKCRNELELAREAFTERLG